MSGYERYTPMRETGSVIRQGNAVYVLGYDEAKQVLGDHKRFVKDMRSLMSRTEREWREQTHTPSMFDLLYDNMLGKDGDEHTRLRSLVSKAFTVRTVQSLAPRIQEIADELIDGFEADGTADLIDVFAFPLPIIVICELLGIPSSDRDNFECGHTHFWGLRVKVALMLVRWLTL